MKRVMFLIFLLCSSMAFAQGFKIAVGLSIPPYVIKESNSGFEIELLEKILRKNGHYIQRLYYASNKRITKLLEDDIVDMALNIQPHLKGVYYSDVFVYFNNVAITLENRDLEIESISDLHYKRVFAFQNAHKFLSKEYKEYAKDNALYSETIHQLSQVKHLIEKRVDVVIADRNIFMYYFRNNHFNQHIQFRFFDVLEPSPRYIGFKNQNTQELFDKTLKRFKQSKEYQELLYKYNLKIPTVE